MSKDDEGQTVFYDRQSQRRAVQKNDGTIELQNKDQRVTMGEGGVTANIPNIRNISIKHLPDIKSYQISDDGFMVTHEFGFQWGGSGVLSYDRSGKLHKFVITSCAVEVSNDGDIAIKQPEQHPEPEPDIENISSKMDS